MAHLFNGNEQIHESETTGMRDGIRNWYENISFPLSCLLIIWNQSINAVDFNWYCLLVFMNLN